MDWRKIIALDEKLPSQDSLFNPPEGSVSREEKSFLSHRVLVSKGHFCSGGDIPSEKKNNFEGKFSLCKLWLYGQSIKNTHYLAVADHNTWKTATVRHSTYISITTYVKLGHSYLKLLETSVENFEIREISLTGGGDFWPEMKAYLL